MRNGHFAPRKGASKSATSMNRHQRRRARRLLNEGIQHLSHSGPMQLTVAATNQIFDPSLDPEIFAGIAQLTAQVMQDKRPLCLTFKWTNLRCPPAAVAVLRPQGLFRDRNANITVMMAFGICRDCWENHHNELIERCLERYRKIWPDLRAADIHEGTDGVQ